MDKLKKQKGGLWQLLPWLWMAAAYLGAVGFMALKGRAYLDSDMAAEMILSDLLNKEGGLLTTNWYYSTEIRVVYQQVIFRLGLGLLPSSWHAARTFSLAVLLALLAGSYLYFAFAGGYRRAGVCSAAALLCPFGFWYMFLVTYGGSYLPHLIFALLSMGLVLRLTRGGTRTRSLVRLAILALVAGCAGLNGIRLLLNLYVPLCAAAVVVLGLRIHAEPDALRDWHRPEWLLLGVSVWAAAASAAGYLVNSKLLSATHHFMSMDNRYWKPISLTGLMDAWGEFLSLFGYQADTFVQSAINTQTVLFSLRGILSAVGLLVAAAVLLSAVLLVLRWNRLGFRQRVVTALFWSCLLLDGAIFAFTAGGVSANATYWVPMLPFVFAMLEVEWETGDFRLPQTRRVLAVLFAVCILGTSAATVKSFTSEPLRGQPALEPVAQWLVNNGYNRGYATFWNSDVLTELTNGQLETWTVGNLGGMGMNGWLQKADHLTSQPAGPVFVLIAPDDRVADIFALPYVAADGSNVVYRDDNGYTVVVFDAAQEIYDAIEAAAAAQANG